MKSHKSVIVQKPWGYEYLAYQNQDVALWVLHIGKDERTSMHCHPTKSTGLVIVEGQANINFIADQCTLTAPAKKMIRRGLFHQTHAISDNGVIMFEVETPVDKDDLVRLRDAYGRTHTGYEGKQYELPKTEDCLWIEDPTTGPEHYQIGTCSITVERVTDKNILETRADSDIIMFLQGGLVKTIDGRRHVATMPGDVGTVEVVKQVAREMDGYADNTILMTIK
jgi:mannose-6-phosphate isomerase-like protein (cupin superfamily)